MGLSLGLLGRGDAARAWRYGAIHVLGAVVGGAAVGGALGLLGALAAEAVPVLLGNAAVRAAVLGSPVVISIGLRSGLARATVRVGRGRAQVVDGVDPASLVVLSGDIEPLIRLAAGVVLREANDLVARPTR